MEKKVPAWNLVRFSPILPFCFPPLLFYPFLSLLLFPSFYLCPFPIPGPLSPRSSFEVWEQCELRQRVRAEPGRLTVLVYYEFKITLPWYPGSFTCTAIHVVLASCRCGVSQKRCGCGMALSRPMIETGLSAYGFSLSVCPSVFMSVTLVIHA